MPSPRPRLWFQFGLNELRISVALIAVALGLGKATLWVCSTLNPPVGVPIFIFAFPGAISCAFATIGVLLRFGLKAAAYGAVLGFVLGAMFAGLVLLAWSFADV